MSKKKQRKVKKRNKAMYWIGAAITALLIISIGTLAMLLIPEEPSDPEELPPPPEMIKEPHLNIENVFFQKEDERTRQTSTGQEEEIVVIKVYSYITNDGTGNADNVKITAFPMDESKNLALDKADKIVGEIKVNKTSESDFLIEVPKGARHSVLLLIWENGKIILKGSGSVLIEGQTGNCEEFRTTEVLGTRNDTDYDGMPDVWENYYGLDPSDPDDAKIDADGDGISNIGEYMSGTEPRAPQRHTESKDKEDDEGGILGTSAKKSSAVSFFGILLIVIILIIIIIIALAVSGSKNPDSPAINKYLLAQTPVQPPAVNKPQPSAGSACTRCGGPLQNQRCVRCGWDHTLKGAPANTGNGNGDNYY